MDCGDWSLPAFIAYLLRQAWGDYKLRTSARPLRAKVSKRNVYADCILTARQIYTAGQTHTEPKGSFQVSCYTDSSNSLCCKQSSETGCGSLLGCYTSKKCNAMHPFWILLQGAWSAYTLLHLHTALQPTSTLAPSFYALSDVSNAISLVITACPVLYMGRIWCCHTVRGRSGSSRTEPYHQI